MTAVIRKAYVQGLSTRSVAARFSRELAARRMDRPARTFALPVPLSRMLAAYTLMRETGPNIGTGIFMPVSIPLERLNKEIKRRTNVVGIFPNEAAVTRLVGTLMLEQNDEWAITRRYMTPETVAAICDSDPMEPAKIAARQLRPSQGRRAKLHHFQGHYLDQRRRDRSLQSMACGAGLPPHSHGDPVAVYIMRADPKLIGSNRAVARSRRQCRSTWRVRCGRRWPIR